MEKTIAVLGPEFSYSHLSLMEHIPDCQPQLCKTITAVFGKVAQGNVRQGWVGIRNSLQGEVEETSRALKKFQVTVVETYDFPIHHCLASQTEGFRIIVSHPQALKQSSRFLTRNQRPAFSIVKATSTSAAMKLAAQDSKYAAVGSMVAAKHYGLQIISECIEDDPSNTTQFGLIKLRTK